MISPCQRCRLPVACVDATGVSPSFKTPSRSRSPVDQGDLARCTSMRLGCRSKPLFVSPADDEDWAYVTTPLPACFEVMRADHSSTANPFVARLRSMHWMKRARRGSTKCRHRSGVSAHENAFSISPEISGNGQTVTSASLERARQFPPRRRHLRHSHRRRCFIAPT